MAFVLLQEERDARHAFGVVEQTERPVPSKSNQQVLVEFSDARLHHS
jgi:hypothetical protein